ncbi:MAG TPA: methylthioribulose 1-phosphate dehydratase [Candidatus Binatia bacterium]|nr:methylthioribulose 1-phosphate dehydratase [Candidatus Binatia bacterium]
MNIGHHDIAAELAAISRSFCGRGWALGTSGNFSAVLTREPLRLAITPSGADKGELNADQILEIGINEAGDPSRKASAEALLHINVVLSRGAGAVLHTHSVWSTIVSSLHAPAGAIMIEGFEMLKGLEGVRSHQHRESLPIVENSQDIRELAEKVTRILKEYPNAHGFLLRQHGLYTWGANLAQAKRHVEVLEFLLETVGRLHSMKPNP